MNTKLVNFLVILLCIPLFVGGQQQAHKIGSSTYSLLHLEPFKGNDSHSKDSKQVTKIEANTKVDGNIISMTKITVPNTSSAVQTYRMMYWSQGTKTEAYVAAPKAPGLYALVVHCHGGYNRAMKGKKHVTSMVSKGRISYVNQTMLEHASKSLVTLVPMYRGYDKSEGYVQGLNGDTIDTQNAIKAVVHYFNSSKYYRHIQKGHVYLFGASMGGGVALNVAAQRQDVIYVIALSPFVGWNIVGNWDENHNLPGSIPIYLYGPFNPNSPKYKQQSIQYQKIKAPTLLIQGTNDDYVHWQTVQTLYRDMKANHQTVSFKLVQGGNHGLMNKREVLQKIYNEWRQKYFDY